jgi:hypothetical protein
MLTFGYSDLVRITDGERTKPGNEGLTAVQRQKITAFVIDAKVRPHFDLTLTLL